MTDGKIVELFWERSEAAISEAERAYGRYCYHIAYGILRNAEDTKETLNDTYLKAWNLIPPEKPSSLKSFLGRIARQLAINRMEKATAQKRGGGEYAIVLEELGDCVAGGSISDPAEQIALRDALNAFLWSQPVQTRRIFIMRYWYVRSIGEIAAELKIGSSKVKMQLLRTREKLRDHLKREGFFYERRGHHERAE